MMHGYYRFLGVYHREPVDADDLFDGIRSIAADNAASRVVSKG
jgi:hypothetical protein